MRSLFIGLIKLYQYIVSPLLGPRCRFHPTCSNYAVEAINQYGVLKGGLSFCEKDYKMPSFERRWV